VDDPVDILYGWICIVSGRVRSREGENVDYTLGTHVFLTSRCENRGFSLRSDEVTQGWKDFRLYAGETRVFNLRVRKTGRF